MSVMLYRYPSKNKSCQGNTGFCEVERVKFDYVIVKDIEKGVPTGWSKTAAEAKTPKKKVAKSLLED
tara:strand:- start:270 stop:470 length:201 start_codon:yes stop_codon:yes gene_type:complete